MANAARAYQWDSPVGGAGSERRRNSKTERMSGLRSAQAPPKGLRKVIHRMKVTRIVGLRYIGPRSLSWGRKEG
jgi:hypothetical protein